MIKLDHNGQAKNNKIQGYSLSGKLLKSGAIVSFMTLISRVLGLARDVVIANLVGAGAAADVYLFANKIPNFLRRLFAEGAFAQAFIPVLSEVQSKEDDHALKLFIARTAGTLGTIVTLVTIIGVIASPAIAALFGTGWFVQYLEGGPEGHKYELASTMLKITFPYLWFITLTGLSGAILNTLNKFAVAAFTPVLLNVAIISAAIWLSPHFDEPAMGLAWGVFLGGALQLFFQVPFLLKAGVFVRPTWGWNDPQVAKTRKLIIPALFGVSVSQINLLLDTVIASFLATGAISWLYYSDRLLEFPLGLFGVAIATVILPTLSKNHAKQDAQQFSQNMDMAVKLVCFLGIPAATGLIMLAEPLLMILFQRGEFTANDTTMASYSLVAYSFGLLSFMLIKVLAPGFFSRQDTKTPVRYGIWAMTANMAFNLILVFPFGFVGLAMATALSATLNAVLLYQKLHRTQVYQLSNATIGFICKVLISSIGMALAIHELNVDISIWSQWEISQKLSQLAILIGASVLLFVALLLAMGIRPHHFKSTTAK